MHKHRTNRRTPAPNRKVAMACFGGARILSILVMTTCLPLAKAAGQETRTIVPSRLCYAFLRDGNLWTVCDGKRAKINFDGKALDFAVSTDGTTLAVQEKQDTKDHSATNPATESVRYSLTLISLKGKEATKTLRMDGQGFLYGTCGTVIFFDYTGAHALDVVTSAPVHFPPFEYFRCSSDRRVVAGWTEEDDARSQDRARTDISKVGQINLRISRPAGLASSTILDPLAIDVSPNGMYVAYFVVPAGQPGPELCVVGPTGDPSCVLGGGHQISVSDLGDVLYWAAGDALSEVKYWHVGKTKTALLEKGSAKHPQWITPEVAAALREWNSHVPHDHGVRP